MKTMESESSNMSSFERFSLFMNNIIMDLITSPLNLGLLAVCVFLLYKIFRIRSKDDTGPPREPPIPKLKRQDFYPADLKQYNGTNAEGRVLVAVNGKVFDVTRNGKQFYGPGGPYATFAGRDASRSLAKFDLEVAPDSDSYDDLSDLTTTEMEGLKEWEMQFEEKYHYVGKLLRPGEQLSHYSDEEEDLDTTPNSKPKDQ